MRQLPLNDYEIKYLVEAERIRTQASGDFIKTFIDIIKSVESLFLHPGQIDYSILERYTGGAIIDSFQPNGTDERYFLLNFHASLPDSSEFVGPIEARELDIKTLEPERKRIGSVFVQYLGPVDKPTTPALEHYSDTTLMNEGKSITSSCEGVLTKTRSTAIESDGSLVVEFTHLVGGEEAMSVELWSTAFVLTPERKIINANDVKIFVEPMQTTSDMLKLGLS